MKPSPTPSKPNSSRSGTAYRGGRASAVLALALLAICGQGGAQQPVAAVWKERVFVFPYRSSVAVFSCSALKGRVATILRALGARPDLKISLANCYETNVLPGVPMNDPVGRTDPVSRNAPASRSTWQPVSDTSLRRRPDQQQSVDVFVRLFTPVEVTPEVLEELKRDRSRRELISHVTGNPAAKFNDPIVFAAQWKSVSLSHETIDLDPAECELLEQMSANDFQGLGVRVVHRYHSCDPDRVSHIAPQLDVEALLVAPSANSHAEPPPVADDDKGDSSARPASGDEPAEPATDKAQE